MALAAAWEAVNARVEQFGGMEPEAAVAALLAQIKDTHSSKVPYLTALGTAGPPAREGDAVSLDGVADDAIGHLAASGLPDARRPAGVVYRIALASLLGKKHDDRRALEDSIKLSREAVRADPESSAAMWSLATAYSHLVEHHGGSCDDAVTAYEEALVQFGGPSRAPGTFLVEYAEFARIHVGDVARSRVLLEEAVLACTKGRSWRTVVRSDDASTIDEPLAVVAASALAQLGLLAQHGAVEEVDGDAAGLRAKYGRLELEDAEALYEASLRCNPLSADTHTNLGLFRSEVQHRWREAAELHRQAIRLDPGHATALYNLGTLVASEAGGGDKEQAVQLYQQAVACQPDHTFALFNLAIAVEEDGDLEKARTYYGLAVASSPDDVSIRCDYATFLWFQARDAPSADEAFQAALAIDADDKNLLRQWIRCATDTEFVAALERSGSSRRRDVAMELAESVNEAKATLRRLGEAA